MNLSLHPIRHQVEISGELPQFIRGIHRYARGNLSGGKRLRRLCQLLDRFDNGTSGKNTEQNRQEEPRHTDEEQHAPEIENRAVDGFHRERDAADAEQFSLAFNRHGEITEFCLCRGAIPVADAASFLQCFLHLWAAEMVVHRVEFLGIALGISPDAPVNIDERQPHPACLSEPIHEGIYLVGELVGFGQCF